MEFYDIQKNWKKLKPHFMDKKTMLFAWSEMEAYSENKSELYGFGYKPRPFSDDWRPMDYDGCDWRYSFSGEGKPGRKPKYWEWVCHGACHWVNNVALLIAKSSLPESNWRIVQSDKHTTVWDGKDTLFDINFLALGVSPEDTWELAANQPDSERLPIGYIPTHH